MFPLALLWKYDSERYDDSDDHSYEESSCNAYDPGVFSKRLSGGRLLR